MHVIKYNKKLIFNRIWSEKYFFQIEQFNFLIKNSCILLKLCYYTVLLGVRNQLV